MEHHVKGLCPARKSRDVFASPVGRSSWCLHSRGVLRGEGEEQNCSPNCSTKFVKFVLQGLELRVGAMLL